MPWRGEEGAAAALVGLLLLAWRLLVKVLVVLSCCYAVAGSPFVGVVVACALVSMMACARTSSLLVEACLLLVCALARAGGRKQ